MAIVSRHISYLLLSCRKVTVPGFGTFTAFYQPALFRPELGIFYPSQIRIKFGADKKAEDSYLLNSLKRKFLLSGKDAAGMLNNFKEKVNRKLNNSRYCRLEGLGYLIKDEAGNLRFTDTFWKFHSVYNQNSLSVISDLDLIG